MRQSIRAKKRLTHQAYLEAEKARYLAIPGQPFRVVKDRDHDPSVIWQGTIDDESLQNDYEIQIHYGQNYPFCRPKVFPVDKSIKRNRHQNPTPLKSQEPGDICIFQDNLDDWVVGITCLEIIQRTKRWFLKYENGTLGDEPAPPEIERYYPSECRSARPAVVLAESLGNLRGQKSGLFTLVPMRSHDFAFLVIIPDRGVSRDVPEEVFRLARLLFPIGAVEDDKTLLGRWYRTNREPFNPQPLVSSDLVRFIARHGNDRTLSEGSICQDYMVSCPQFVAICYPTPFAELHWIVYRFDFHRPPISKNGVVPGFRKQAQHKEILRQNQNKGLIILPTHHISEKALFKRVSQPTFRAIQKAAVLLLGCGTVGSRVAELLIKSGLGRLRLADKDELRVGNVCRHVLGLDKLGQNKAVALKEHLLQRNPFAEIEVFSKDILDADTWLSMAIQKADLVVSCMGRDAAETWINQCAMNLYRPVLFCRTYAHATIGEILLARPGRCCFGCASEHLRDPECSIPRPPELGFQEMVDFDTDCGTTFIPASATDVDFVSLSCARLATLLLCGDDLTADYWIVRGRAFGEDENWNIAEELLPAFRVLDYSVQTLRQCEVCGNREVGASVEDKKSSKA